MFLIGQLVFREMIEIQLPSARIFGLENTKTSPLKETFEMKSVTIMLSHGLEHISVNESTYLQKRRTETKLGLMKNSRPFVSSGSFHGVSLTSPSLTFVNTSTSRHR